jgi:hypothetical protein
MWISIMDVCMICHIDSVNVDSCIAGCMYDIMICATTKYSDHTTSGLLADEALLRSPFVLAGTPDVPHTNRRSTLNLPPLFARNHQHHPPSPLLLSSLTSIRIVTTLCILPTNTGFPSAPEKKKRGWGKEGGEGKSNRKGGQSGGRNPNLPMYMLVPPHHHRTLKVWSLIPLLPLVAIVFHVMTY